MARRLERAGLRAISPLVDITNYVMLERGQPMHAFDHAKLEGAIDVRFMRPGESIKLLNEQGSSTSRTCSLITDASGPVALGGVMGGFDTMVDGRARRTCSSRRRSSRPRRSRARRASSRSTSDAAYRFERGVDFAGTRAALERATELTLGDLRRRGGPGHARRAASFPRARRSACGPPRVRALLGYDVPDASMARDPARLSLRGGRATASAMRATPPSWRFDLAIEEDFVEEVARVHGYEHVPARAPRSQPADASPREEGTRTRFDLKRAAAALGYQEVINYSFVSVGVGDRFRGQRAPRCGSPIPSRATWT